MYYHRSSQSLLGDSFPDEDNRYAFREDALPESHGQISGSWSQELVASLNQIQQPERVASRDGRREPLDTEALMRQPNYSTRWTIEDSRQIEQQVLNLLQRSSIETVSVVKKPKLVIPPTIITPKGPRVVSTLKSAAVEYDSDSISDQFNILDREQDVEANIPDNNLVKTRPGIWPRSLRVCRRLFTFVILLNIIAAVAIVALGVPRESMETMIALNFTIALLVRQDIIVNTAYAIFCRVPTSWPLWFRQQCAKVHLFSSAHSSAVMAAAIWLLAHNIGNVVCMATNNCYGSWKQQSAADMTISWFLLSSFIVMLVATYSAIRKKHHDLFANIHQVVGLATIILFWAQVILALKDTKPANQSLGRALVSSVSFWLLTVSTICVISSWFWLRKVPVRAEFLSEQALQLHFDSKVPANGSVTRFSYKNLTSWRSFSTIKALETLDGRPRGHSVIVFHTGSWTQSMMNSPPTHVWTRGLPVCSVMSVATLFKRLVVVCTGSNITSVLDHVRFSSIPTKLIWSTSDPEETCGNRICNFIKSRIPDVVIHNTSRQGKPDLVKMSYNMAKDFDAEAVIIVADEGVVKQVVYGLETRGVIAYGSPCDK